jgi:hypothetical protein
MKLVVLSLNALYILKILFVKYRSYEMKQSITLLTIRHHKISHCYLLINYKKVDCLIIPRNQML